MSYQKYVDDHFEDYHRITVHIGYSWDTFSVPPFSTSNCIPGRGPVIFSSFFFFFSFSFYPFSIRPSRSLNLSIALWSIISLQLRSLLSIIFPFLSRVINQTNSPPTLPQPHSIGARTPARIDQSVHRTRDKPTAGTILYARIPPLRSSVLYSSPSTLNLTWRWTVMTLFSYLG